jgi:amino acid adenylation domain-containing protein
MKSMLAAAGLQREAGEAIQARPEGAAAPLSFAQERLWFLDRMVGESPVFNIPAAFRISGPLDVGLLERCLGEIVARHESLRTTFAVEGDRTVQVIAAAARVVLELEDMTALPAEARQDEALRRAREEGRRRLDVSGGPLARFCLWKLDSGEHLLLLVIHHIVCEVQSIGVLVRELQSLYTAGREGVAATLPELPAQFADFAAWQRGREGGPEFAAQLDYWKRKLAGGQVGLALPTRPRPAVQTFEGSTRSRALPAELVGGLRELCRRENVTLFSAMLAAFSAVLARYGRQDDVWIGAPMTDRNRRELEGLIGFFVNTLVLRCDHSGEPSLRELLRRSREVVLEAQANQDLPFEHLVEALQPGRDLSRSPLFQVAILLQNEIESGPERAELAPGVAMRPLDPLAVHTETSKFDCSLVVWNKSDGIGLSCEYNTDLFEPETIDRLLGHVQTLLEGGVAEPDRKVSSLPLLTAGERRQIRSWNSTAADIPREACVHELFEAQVDRAPDRLAVACGAEELTYRELDRRANQLARHLRELGVGPDTPVGMCTQRSLELAIGILGTLKAGGAYVPLDLAYPTERLAYMLADAHAPVVLTREELAGSIPEHGGKTVCVDADWPEISKHSDERLGPISSAKNLAYVIYTSGSTGKPKGVALAHTGLVNLLTWHQREYDVGPEDRATHLAGLAFDASVWELWPYLTAGSSLHLAPEEVRLSPTRLLEWLEEKRITQSFIPTPLAEAMLNEEMPDGLALEFVLTGGDKLHRAPAAGLPFKLVNHYGPTENTVVATYTVVHPDPDSDVAPPIGKPISNVQVHLFDQGGQLVPIGVPGELCISGSSLAHGYYGRPDLSAEKFVQRTVDGDEPRRMYTTGDLARYRPDGNIEFLGRIDGQVKVRGFRIELGEIEAVLSQHPAVAECCVMIRSDVSGARPEEGTLVAYTVADPGAPASDAKDRTAELRSALKRALPEYMLPAAFVTLDAMPLTPNGKIDMRALPAPAPPSAEAAADFVLPDGELEEIIAGTWRETLRLEQVGAHTNFFEMGGHSLLMAQVHIKLQTALGRELSIIELFQFPTVSSLAAHLADRSAENVSLRQGRERAESRRARMGQRRRVRGGG